MFEKLAAQIRKSDINYPLLVPLLVSSFLIHLLLIFALISIIMNFVGGRRAV